MNSRRVPNATERASSTESPPVRPAKAKAERGYQRSKDGKQSFEKAKAVELDPRMPCAEAFRTALRISANEAGLLTLIAADSVRSIRGSSDAGAGNDRS